LQQCDIVVGRRVSAVKSLSPAKKQSAWLSRETDARQGDQPNECEVATLGACPHQRKGASL
jgi:hypothetical protein